MPACRQCSSAFEIADDDLAFLDKISPIFNGKKESIPPPTLCADCRLQRRLSFRNERKLYHRKCDLTGRQIISVYSPDKPHKVYEYKEWWSDKWDPMSYAKDIDWEKPFFEQFKKLYEAVPIPHAHMESCENSDYANFCWETKDVYLVFASDRSQDCYYSNLIIDCHDCIDCSCSKRCSYCYQVMDCTQCYRCFYSQDCTNCEQVDFSIDCKNCKNCFGCTGLRNKEFHLFNQPLSQEEYESKISELVLNAEAIEKAKAIAESQWKTHPRIYANLLQCEDCTGNNLLECSNCKACFDAMGATDSMRLQNCTGQTHDCRDVYGIGYGSERCYESYCTASKNTLFSCLVFPGGNNVFYSANCSNCQDIFGCIGLRHKKYCIFNKQYTKEEYELLVPKLIEHMRKTDEWGEFFPVTLSAFGYNETIAQEHFPLSEEEVRARGWQWQTEEETKEQYLGPAYEVPEDIRSVSDDITKHILRCDVTSKPYKIIPQELAFYREMNIPIPKKSPDQRHTERMAMRSPYKLWQRECMKCHKAMETPYSPERPEIVYCEECYLSTVY